MYIMWWGGAVLCMNTVYVLTCHLLQDYDQDTFFLSVLTVLCIYQFPEIFPENISKIFLPASCCFVVYKKKIKLNNNLSTVLEKQEWQLLERLGFRPRSWVHTCWFTSVTAQSWVTQALPALYLNCLKPLAAKTWLVPKVQQSWGLSRKHFRLPCQFDTDDTTSHVGEEDMWRLLGSASNTLLPTQTESKYALGCSRKCGTCSKSTLPLAHM